MQSDQVNGNYGMMIHRQEFMSSTNLKICWTFAGFNLFWGS